MISRYRKAGMVSLMLVSPLLDSEIGAPDGFVIAEWRDPGCPAEGPMPIAPLHLHRECDEAWIVLEGTLVVQNGDEELTVPTGAAAYVRRGTPHTFWNPSPEPCRYLLVMTAKTRALIHAIHSTEDRSLSAMRAMFESFGAELLI